MHLVDQVVFHQRAHTGSSGSGTGGRPARQPDTAAERRLVARLTDALERADLDALIELVVTDVRLSMPHDVCRCNRCSEQRSPFDGSLSREPVIRASFPHHVRVLSSAAALASDAVLR